MSDEEALKRSARRRLIGAVALALVTVVALPMIFDKEPPPLADVEIVIPSRDTPGKSVLLEGGSAVPGGTDSATPSLSATAPSPTLNAPASVTPSAVASSAVASSAVASPAVTPPRVTPPSSVAPVLNAPARKPADVAATKDGAKIDLPKPSPSPAAASGIFLQLGVFSAEEGAKRMAKRVVDAGFTVHVVEDAGRYKVRCGPVSGKPAAQDLQMRLRDKGFTAVLVNP